MLIITLGSLFLTFLVLDVVALCSVTIEGVHRAKDGPKFACRVNGCNASYTTKYNLVWHLRAHNIVTMEPKSLDAHIFKGKAWGIKITWLWMHRFWTTLWSGSITMNKRQLLGLRGTQTWSGIGFRLIYNTHLRFLSWHLLN